MSAKFSIITIFCLLICSGTWAKSKLNLANLSINQNFMNENTEINDDINYRSYNYSFADPALVRAESRIKIEQINTQEENNK